MITCLLKASSRLSAIQILVWMMNQSKSLVGLDDLILRGSCGDLEGGVDIEVWSRKHS